MSKFTKWAVIAILLLAGTHTSLNAQSAGLKTNFLHWGVMGSPNAAVEFSLSRKMTADIYGGANLWKFSPDRNIRHWMVQPELRYWFCETFNGHFIGLHGHGGQYNVGGWDIPVGRLAAFKDHRYQGYFYGAGLSYGYQWILSKHWNLEASIGGGYARIWYEQFPCAHCGAKISEGNYDYFGITRATLSLVYVF